MLTSFKRFWPLAIAAVAVLAIGFTACNDDDADAEDSDTAARVEALEAAQQRTDVVATINTLEAAEFHAIDDELQVASEIPEGTSTTIERTLQISSSTNWPDELADYAGTLNTTLQEFLDALEAEDLQASKGLATETHDAWHDMQHDAYAWVAGEELGGEDGHDDGDGSSEESPTPTAAS